MYRAREIASYFISKDTNKTVFDKTLINKNGCILYEGNARLNKYLHISQNIYIAKTGEKLFEDDLYAYANGAVVPSVQENYAVLCAKQIAPTLSDDIKDFLDKIYEIFRYAELDELIEISHEDSEWEEKQRFNKKAEQRMDSLAHIEEYKEQYTDILRIMNGM